ncbi:unnamed protein product [Sphacelaria rigidula]
MDGTISFSDVPKLWGEKMEEMLGVSLPGDAEGCMKDINW